MVNPIKETRAQARSFLYRIYHLPRFINPIFQMERLINSTNCTDDSYFLCDRVCAQNKKLKEDILVAFDRGKMWAGKWCITFWVLMRKHREIYLHSIRISVQCIRTSVQCINPPPLPPKKKKKKKTPRDYPP